MDVNDKARYMIPLTPDIAGVRTNDKMKDFKERRHKIQSSKLLGPSEE